VRKRKAETVQSDIVG